MFKVDLDSRPHRVNPSASYSWRTAKNENVYTCEMTESIVERVRENPDFDIDDGILPNFRMRYEESLAPALGNNPRFRKFAAR